MNVLEREKTKELIDATRVDTLDKKMIIVNASTSEDNCVERMEGNVDNFVIQFVAAHPFMKNVALPVDAIEELKKDLEPIFRAAFKRTQV